MHVTFRKAALEDEPGVLKLLGARHDEVHPNIPRPNAETWSELFRETIASDTDFIIVGDLDGEIVATVTVYILPRIRLGGYFALFESVVVKADVRKQGIGTKLVGFAVGECRKDPRIKKIKLGSKKDEEGVHAFYGKMGFAYGEKLFQLRLAD